MTFATWTISLPRALGVNGIELPDEEMETLADELESRLEGALEEANAAMGTHAVLSEEES